MGLMTNWKARKALTAHGRSRTEEAFTLYEEAYAEGMNSARYLLPYSILLLRKGLYEKASEVLRKVEKSPGGITAEQRNQMLTNYAVACWKTGRLPYALELLQEVYRKGPNGTLYGTLGYLLIEQGNFDEALAFNLEAVAYDDEDPICLDNLAQTYYRLGGPEHREEARKYFEKALQHRESAIDTNYFLALYDLEDGNVDAARKKLLVSREGRFSPLNYVTPDVIDAKLKEIGAEIPEDEA